MTRAFPQSTSSWRQCLALGAASVVALLLFLLIPLTQSLDGSVRDVLEYREMKIAMPPPPPFVPPPPALEEHEEEFVPEPPSMEKPLEDVPIQQLELSLSPGMGVALAMGVPNMPDISEGDLSAEIERIFNFDELSRVPSLLNAQMIRAQFPRDLARKGVRQARVELEILIDKRGRVEVTRILSSTHDHAQLKEAARKAGAQARFSVTKVDGQPVTVRGRFPIALQAPR